MPSLLPDPYYSSEIAVPIHRVRHFLDDLQSLSESWNSVAVNYRVMPSTWWSRLINEDIADVANTLEDSARQLDAAIKRFQESA